MTDPPLSTMAAPAAAIPSHATKTACTASTETQARPVPKSLVKRDFDLALRAFFPLPTAPIKFNPIGAMQQLLRTLLKDEQSLVLRTPSNDQQIILNSQLIPTGEKAFKQFFTVSTPRAERQKQQYVCVGCHVLSNRTLSNIKFHSETTTLLAWLKKNKVFLESDRLGIERPITIGYFTKIAPEFTHLANFREYLANQLLMIEIDADTAIDLAPHLKQAQIDAMSNGDDYVPILPHFEIYKTKLSHGRAPNQIQTEVLGVKSAPKDAKLLGEFFTRLAAEGNNHHDGVFLPKGAAYLLGPDTYGQVLKDNNFFLNHVATIPVNLEYSAWFAVIDPENHSADAPVSLHEHLLRQSWFLRVESVTRQKCNIVTTRANLPDARKWIDDNLHLLIGKSLPPGSDTPLSLLPRRLDKPTFTKTTTTYADMLKRQFSLDTKISATDENHNRPPRKRHASFLDYATDPSTEFPPLAPPAPNNPSTTVSETTTHASTTTVNYAAELQLIKTELASLRTLINAAVEQMKRAVESITTTAPAPISNPPTPPTNAMDIDDEHTSVHRPAPNIVTTNKTPDISATIAELQKDIEQLSRETQEFTQQKLQTTANRNLHQSPVT